MHLLQFTTVKLSLCRILGILTGDILHLSLNLSIFICIFLVLLLGSEHHLGRNVRSLRFGLLALFLTLSIGNLGITLTRHGNKPDHYAHFAVHEKHVYTLKIREVLKSNAFSDRYMAHVIWMDSLSVSGKILLNIAKDTTL